MRDLIKLGVIAGVFILSLLGWAFGGHAGAAIGFVTGLLLLVVPWRGQPLWSWLVLYLRRNRPISLADPVMVANDRAGGGIRYQDDTAVAAIQVLGKPHQPTYFTGSHGVETENTLDITGLFAVMRQSLGLVVDSISVISFGARRRSTGDYARVYDTLIGTPPYAGQRETWLVVRICALSNGDAFQYRTTIGAGTLAAAQRIAMMLRRNGIRARVASAADIEEFERRLGWIGLEPRNRRWTTVRGEGGWQTTYAYRPADITAETLAQAWSLRADGVIQNVTLLDDGTASATVTVRTAQPPTAPPAVLLRRLPGEQVQAALANHCGPRPALRGVATGRLPRPVTIPIGPSGVLLGKTCDGDRLALPMCDPADPSRLHLAADDPIAKRIIIRMAAAGERVTVHTTDLERWGTVRMPNVAVVEHPRPAPGTTVSVVDGTVVPAPRPNTVVTVVAPGTEVNPSADVVISQTGPDAVEVNIGDRYYDVEVEFFRAENLYVSRESIGAELEMAE